MESKGVVDRLSGSAALPGGGSVVTDSTKELDSVALLRLCANDTTNHEIWHEFLSRFLGRIQFFVFKASRLEWSGLMPASSQSYTTSGQDQQDLVQEVLVRLTARDCLLLKRFRGDSEENLARYLSVIATSVAVDHYKYLQRQRRLQHTSRLERVDQALLDRIGMTRDDLKLERSILLREVMQITEELLQQEVVEIETRRRYLLIFRLHFCDGLSLAEIGRYCGVDLSKKGVDKIITKITGRLKERIKRRGEVHG